MPKQNIQTSSPKNQSGKSEINYAYKPAKIGPLLKFKSEQNGLTPRMVAETLKVDVSVIYRAYKRTYLTIPQMAKWSEIFQENLYEEYYPNIKPLPNEQEALRKENGAMKQEIIELEQKRSLLLEEIIRLKAQNELLKEQIREANSRK